MNHASQYSCLCVLPSLEFYWLSQNQQVAVKVMLHGLQG